MSAMPRIFVRDMEAADLPRLDLQPDQRAWLDLRDAPLSEDYGADLLRCGPCFTAVRADGTLLACAGFAEQHPRYAVVWALLSGAMGADHLAFTRAAAARIEACAYDRVEALIRADHQAGARWARLVGLFWNTRIRKAGPAGEDFDLFERVRP